VSEGNKWRNSAVLRAIRNKLDRRHASLQHGIKPKPAKRRRSADFNEKIDDSGTDARFGIGVAKIDADRPLEPPWG